MDEKKLTKKNLQAACGCTVEGCDSLFSRRTFIQLAGSAAAATGLNQKTVAFAGPFGAQDTVDHLIPRDKKLSAQWIKTLYERAAPEVFRGAELKYIGMPVGGIGCGQVYLGGDGRLWHWDIFDSRYQSLYGSASMGLTYVNPAKPGDDQDIQGFSIKVNSVDDTQVRELNVNGFSDIGFTGQYPIGRVEYRDDRCPVEVKLEAFSPFIPLNAEDSAMPATIMNFQVTNTTDEDLDFTLAGWMKNSVCKNAKWPQGVIQNEIVKANGLASLVCSPKQPQNKETEANEDIVFADFETEKYDGWKSEGKAFGDGPFLRSEMAAYQDLANHHGKRTVNSHNTRVVEGTQNADQLTGRLTSKPFKINRNYIQFLVCGGQHSGKTCINLIVDGKKMATATGHNSNRMRREVFDVSMFAGKQAYLEIVDSVSGGWGNIGIDQIVFSDEAPQNDPEGMPGYGTMALSLLEGELDGATAILADDFSMKSLFEETKTNQKAKGTRPFGEKLVGAISSSGKLNPGETQTVTFLVSWWFPNYPNVTGELAAIKDIQSLSRHYKSRFDGARQVAESIKNDFERLAGDTRLWNKTWYDSTLPHWLLDRTFVTVDCVATQVCHWFDNGRFYGWEGVNCCPGTCQHVWNYAQGLARIFPSIERSVREDIDFGIAFHSNGALDYRAESGQKVATDGQCGTIVRAYREHLTSKDDEYLRRIWPKVKKSIEFMIGQDGGMDGLLEGEQYNTLDQAWFGPMGWISSMYLSALAAGEAMANDINDASFANRCRRIIDAGQQNIVDQLFNGEYFIHKPDPKFPKATNTNEGCHIDQVFGQSLCSQLGLPRVVPARESVSALESIWQYNFAPDAGGYREQMQSTIKGGRPYALKGEAGLVMTTWPHRGADKAGGIGGFETAKGYFNECMTGFEYQVAAHMIYEGEPGSKLVEKGLAIVRAIHDRYHASRRNPYNEIECGDHYSRAMASYGVFLAVCGFEYHGPKGEIGFAPRLSPENFKAPFVAAECWGTIIQTRQPGSQRQEIKLKHGALRLSQLRFEVSDNHTVKNCVVTRGGKVVHATQTQDGTTVGIQLSNPIALTTGAGLIVKIE